jgi:hypothetical protein
MDHVVEPEWLRDAVGEMQRMCNLNRVVSTRHANDRDRRELRIAKLRLAKREAVHYGHREIEQDDVWPRLSGNAQRLGAVRRRQHDMTVGAQCHLEKRAGIRVVIDDKYIGHTWIRVPTLQEIHHGRTARMRRFFNRYKR